ncbi:carboxymuconolactone decarboxylase family protein [Rugamonas sp.]|uniref:carboxymuconolactone decarboxylase family protein n=1 Tax=Rugamonas sp. TaxID=1926287 RepID=UPI0025CCDD39|nr:carboxymuconolactone decarboxylase family protein [Rugamonas sp.]
MSRLTTLAVADTTGAAAPLYAAIKGAMGKVPNAYVTIGTNSPVALEAALTLDGALRKSSLNGKDIEVIKLAVSQKAQCDYCLAAHSLAAKKHGLSPEAIHGVRHGESSGEARFDALSTFARTVVSTSGTVPQAVLDAVKAAGISDAEIVDALLAIASITFTNLFNRVNDTTLDFPAAAA